jgi:hypothetical protein
MRLHLEQSFSTTEQSLNTFLAPARCKGLHYGGSDTFREWPPSKFQPSVLCTDLRCTWLGGLPAGRVPGHASPRHSPECQGKVIELTYLAVSDGRLLLGHKLLCCLSACLGAQILNLRLAKDDVGVRVGALEHIGFLDDEQDLHQHRKLERLLIAQSMQCCCFGS